MHVYLLNFSALHFTNRDREIPNELRNDVHAYACISCKLLYYLVLEACMGWRGGRGENNHGKKTLTLTLTVTPTMEWNGMIYEIDEMLTT